MQLVALLYGKKSLPLPVSIKFQSFRFKPNFENCSFENDAWICCSKSTININKRQYIFQKHFLRFQKLLLGFLHNEITDQRNQGPAAPVGMWTWGSVHTKFRQPPYKTLSQPGGQIMPTLYWCPHQVLKATGARLGPIFTKLKWNEIQITSVSKKLGQNAVVHYNCALSQFF